MIIYPAIDLKGGQCVRLYKGDMTQDTVYNDDPGAQALTWARAGFSWLHVVDLDGAFSGASENTEAVRHILNAVDIPVQLGGGIRSLAHIERWIADGVSRVILGTVAVRDPALVKEACALFPNQIVVGIDARKGRVAVEGWAEDSDVLAVDLAKQFEDAGVAAIIYTDIERDGTGAGVNVETTFALSEKTKIPVIASGGIGSLDDVRAVKAAGGNIQGVIVGKALYEGQVDPKSVLEIAA